MTTGADSDLEVVGLALRGTQAADLRPARPEEMAACAAGNLPASTLGHVPVSGAGGSLGVLSRLKVKDKVFVHLNNTNPMLVAGSPQQAAVLAAGCRIGRDGMEFVI